jgi:hypothetical protein
MAQLAIAAVFSYAGSAIGAAFGAAAIGGAVGWAVGSYIGATLFAPDVNRPRIDDLRWGGLEYGASIPWYTGKMSLPGIPVWMSEKRVIEGSDGGKGSGGGSEPTPDRIVCDALFLLADVPSDALLQIYYNGELLWDGEEEDDALSSALQAVIAYLTNEAHAKFTEVRFYGGDAAQDPDPTYLAAVANAPALRHRTSVFLGNLELPGGQLPQLKFVVARDADGDAEVFREDFGNDLADYAEENPGDSGVFNIIETPYGNGIQGINPPPTTGDYEVVRDITDANVRYFEIFFRVDVRDTDDANTFFLTNSLNTTFFRLSPVRDVNQDAAQRILVYFNGTEYFMGTAAAPVGTWLKCSFSVVGPPSEVVVKIQSADGSVTLASQNFVHPFDTVDIGGVGFGYGPGTFIGTDFPSIATFARFTTSASGASPNYPTLPEVITELCERADLDASQIDVSQLPETEVPGIVAPQVTNARSVLASLMAWHFVEAVEGETLKFIQRGGASDGDILYDDLVADGDSPRLVITIDNDNERPGYVALSYINQLTSFERGVEYSDRLTTDANGTKAVEFAILATPAQAKGRADTIVYDAQVSRTTFKFSVALNDYPELEATDVRTLYDVDGTTYRVRLLRITDSGGVRSCEAVLDDASILSESGITSEDYEVVGLSPVGESTLILLDTGLLSDATNEPGLYAAVDGSGRWFGASIQRSVDDSAYTEVATAEGDAVSGYCETALPTWTGGYVWDVVNTVRVRVTGELSSSTKTAMHADRTLNTFAIIKSDGVVTLHRFRTATLITAHDDGSNTYDLTRLLHGVCGTEHSLSGYAVYDQFVLLELDTTVSIANQVSSIGSSRYYKGVTYGRSLSTAPSIQFTEQSIRLKPWAPVRVRGERDGSGNLTAECATRTRLSTRFGGTGGSYIPESETTIRTRWLIRNAGDTTTLRTVDVDGTELEYSAADQTTDFGSPQSSIKVRVAQLSDRVGAGYYTAKTI